MLRFNKRRKVSYSSLLIEFIEPMLTGHETDEEFLTKAIVGQIAWNYAVSDKAGLAMDGYMKQVLKSVTEQYEDAQESLNALVLRKGVCFEEYDQLILKVEQRHKPDGSTTLYVESAPASILKKLGA